MDNINIQMVDLKNQIPENKKWNWWSYTESFRFITVHSWKGCEWIWRSNCWVSGMQIHYWMRFRHRCASNCFNGNRDWAGWWNNNNSFTFVATTETIALLGAVPVYVDINEKTYNIDPGKIESKITPKTKAIIPVHLYGQPAEMDEIMAVAKKHNIKVIEDAAQAFGAVYKGKKVSGIGDIGTISFFPQQKSWRFRRCGNGYYKWWRACRKMKMISVHGSEKRYYHEVLGINSRLDSIQAAVLKVKLKYAEEYHEARIKAAGKYNERFKEYWSRRMLYLV